MDDLNKFMNEINWLVSLLVAIPLSIAGNLLTPLFHNWKAGKSKRAAKARLTTLEKEIAQAKRLASDLNRLNTYLLVSLLTVILFFALPGVFGGFVSVLFILPSSMDGGILPRFIGASSGMFSALFNLMAVVRAIEAVKVYKRVANFSNYEIETNALIERLRANAA